MPSEKNSDLLFSKETYNDFSRELSKEVKDYFANNSLNRYADSFMVIKMCPCLGIYLALYFLFYQGIFP